MINVTQYDIMHSIVWWALDLQLFLMFFAVSIWPSPPPRIQQLLKHRLHSADASAKLCILHHNVQISCVTPIKSFWNLPALLRPRSGHRFLLLSEKKYLGSPKNIPQAQGRQRRVGNRSQGWCWTTSTLLPTHQPFAKLFTNSIRDHQKLSFLFSPAARLFRTSHCF